MISIDEWKEWHAMTTTKELVKEFEKMKNEILLTIPLHLSNEHDRSAIIDSGIVRGIDLVIDIIHSKKEESADDGK